MDKEKEALDRIKGLIRLQHSLFEKYGNDNYNVFIFGSYPTVRYKEGKSDIDVAVYTVDIDLYKKISFDIEEHFYELGIRSDIFYIDETVVAPIFVAPLNSQIQFTDYYPEELTRFRNACEECLRLEKERLAG